MPKAKILIVEDAADQRLIIKASLADTYDVIMATSFNEGFNRYASENIDLVILDIGLGDEGDAGFELCSSIRRHPKGRAVPILFLSGRSDVNDKVHGLKLGGDDYMTKPFSALEIRARVEVLLRRTKALATPTEIQEVGGLHIDSSTHSVKTEIGGTLETLDMTAKEFKLLKYFVKHIDQVLTREQILETVWGDAVHVLDRSVDSRIAALRRKLKHKSHYIQSVHGVGYRFSISEETKKKSA